MSTEIFTYGTYADWCAWLYDGLADGGEWVVPRSHLIFRKDEATREFVLIAEGITGQTEVDPLTDYLAIRKEFAAAGITVRREGE